MKYKIVVGQPDMTRKPHETVVKTTSTLGNAEALLETINFKEYSKQGYTYAVILPERWVETKFGASIGLVVCDI